MQRLAVRTGQYSSAGRKPVNQDFHGLALPTDGRLEAKGIVLAVADGISSSPVAREASQAAVTGFLEDYYCTSEAWSVRRAAERVLAATNAWLYAQTQAGQGRWDKDRGWACTFSALVLKGRSAHLFHIGDARIWQLQGRTLEPLTAEHRIHVGGGQSYLGRALGIAPQVEIDHRTLPVVPGDTFVLSTDGVHGHLPAARMAALLAQHGEDLEAAARAIVEAALAAGSEDNLTLQLVRVDAVPQAEAGELAQRAAELPPAGLLAPRSLLDGLRIQRELHHSDRSHVYLALDEASGQRVVVKTPSTEMREDRAALERFLMEEWIARRVDSPHLLKACLPDRPRTQLYTVMEYVPGRTLAQWMRDHPRPSVDEVRDIVVQLARGLRTLHRAEMVHQDLRPANVMVDEAGTVRLIDFGATQVAGVLDAGGAPLPLPGTAQYMAPEYFLGAAGTARSDLFSLAVITYQLLTGRLPYGMDVAKCRDLAGQKRLRARPVTEFRRDVPAWVDAALREALQVEPQRRPADVDEFVHALLHPVHGTAAGRPVPLIARDPVVFWKALSLLLGLGCLALLGMRALGH
ncbi:MULTISPECIES: bifunctional protein-serine/threonine kinase/phosphatase [Ramlibacter]|uniref:Protein kinase n=1 Tax=Ramlibacter aquaticus TaxID=2780094 RepID=A0ABR9SIZ7_9BURK|nr:MULTISPECIES: bifunctional protein-serine/threonine kinase/phosphatase [Ramlibacter]MBE7942134.1 protein kinase [Ramlibacter aquaticus]